MWLSALLVTAVSGAISPSAGATVDSLAVPGVSAALATHRSARVADVRYDLALDVTGADTAVGRVTVRFQLKSPGDLLMDFRGLALRRVRVNGAVLEAVAFDGHHVRLPGAALATGANSAEFEFASRIAAAGASIIRVNDPSDGARYLYTLLVPSDAQLLFPCFDQPDLKARVSLTLTTPHGWTAVANGGLMRADSSSRGVTFAFRETAPISTYLVAFAAGPWATFTSSSATRPIRLYVRQSRAREVEADSIVLLNDRALSWLEQYFASPYPFGKMDVVLAPAFPFGGMEHPGAIFYSEERFIYREPPTLPQRLNRTATIYHEVAHQWFGDLVTMRWFDDLWLKEGFSTYMAAKMQAELDPRSEAWKSFYLRNKPVAYAVDVTDGTTPVWQRLENLDQAKSNYGAIVYNKAPSVLKQLNYLVGDDAFQRGVQQFIRRHQFANATWRDLLESIGSAWGRSLESWGNAYILRPGMPVIEQRVDVQHGRVAQLTLVQRPARALSGARPWPIRTEVMVVPPGGPAARIPVTLAADTTVVAQAAGLPAPAWVFANGGDAAYALVLLDTASIGWLEHSMSRVGDSFSRAMLYGALWDLVRNAALSPERYLRLVERELPSERDEQIVAGLLGRVARIATSYLGAVQQRTLLPSVEHLLWQRASDSTLAYGLRRSYLDALIRIAATPAMVDSLTALLDRTQHAGLPVGAPTRWAIVTRLVATSHPAASRLLDAEARRDSTAEGARRAFVAHAAVPDARVKAEYFARYFEDAALNEDWATASLDAFNAPESRAQALPYLRPALDSLPWIQRNRRIFYLGSWLGAFLDGHVSPQALASVQLFLEQRRDLAPDLRSKVLQQVDELERTVRIREKYGRE